MPSPTWRSLYPAGHDKTNGQPMPWSVVVKCLPYAAKGRQVDGLEARPLAGPELVGLIQKVFLVHMDDLALGAHHQHRVVVAWRAVHCIPRGQQANCKRR